MTRKPAPPSGEALILGALLIQLRQLFGQQICHDHFIGHFRRTFEMGPRTQGHEVEAARDEAQTILQQFCAEGHCDKTGCPLFNT
jgi:hypothetical protein